MSNVEIISVTLLSDKCYRCGKPWKHIVHAKGIDDALYFCDECLEYIKNHWKRPFRVAISSPGQPSIKELKQGFASYRGNTQRE